LKITSSDSLANKSQEYRKGFLDSNFSGVKSIACRFILCNFLLVVPLIAQGVYTEADYNAPLLFSVVSCPGVLYASSFQRSRQPLQVIFSTWIVRLHFDLHRRRAGGAFVGIPIFKGVWLGTAHQGPAHDLRNVAPRGGTGVWWEQCRLWGGFALFLFWAAGFQLNYLSSVSCQQFDLSAGFTQ
jgi:hypothetical protein